MEVSEQSHSVSSGTIPDPQDPKRNIQLAGTRLPSTLDEGTRKSQHLPEGTTTDPKDSGGNVQSADKGLPSMVFNEGTAKTTPLRDKDSDGNKPPADIEPVNPTVANPSGKTSFEVEPDLQTLQFTTVADLQAYLLSLSAQLV
ncbi:hypothetical protein Tco_1515785 [Tanacetum coccineum]